MSGVDIGHSRVPDPPDSITGTIGVECGMLRILRLNGAVARLVRKRNHARRNAIHAGETFVQLFFVNFCDSGLAGVGFLDSGRDNRGFPETRRA